MIKFKIKINGNIENYMSKMLLLLRNIAFCLLFSFSGLIESLKNLNDAAASVMSLIPGIKCVLL